MHLTLSDDRGIRIESYRKDGLMIVRNAVPDRTLKALQNKLIALVSQRHERYLGTRKEWYASRINREQLDSLLLDLYRADPRHEAFIYDSARFLPETLQLVADESVVGLVREALCLGIADPVNLNNVNLRVDMPGEAWMENLPWHQDWPYQNPLYLKNNSVGSWIAVFDCPLETGPVIWKRGSHVWGELPPVEVPSRGDARTETYTLPEPYLNDPASGEIQIAMQAGDLVIFDLTTVHKSGINRSSQLIRWSAQARYHGVLHPHYLAKYDPPSLKTTN